MSAARASMPVELLGIPIVWSIDPELGLVGKGNAWWGIFVTVHATGDAWLCRVGQAYLFRVEGRGESPAEAAADARTRLGCIAAVQATLRRLEAASRAGEVRHG